MSSVKCTSLQIWQCLHQGGKIDYDNCSCVMPSKGTTVSNGCPKGYRQNPYGSGCIPIVTTKLSQFPKQNNMNSANSMTSVSLPITQSALSLNSTNESLSPITSTTTTVNSASKKSLSELMMQYKYEIIVALFVIIIIYYIARK